MNRNTNMHPDLNDLQSVESVTLVGDTTAEMSDTQPNDGHQNDSVSEGSVIAVLETPTQPSQDEHLNQVKDKADQKRQKRKQSREWASSVNLTEDVQFSEDKSQIISIKGTPTKGTAISHAAISELCILHNIKVSRSKKKADLYDLLKQYIQGKISRDHMEKISFKKQSGVSAHPLFVTKPGTFYRVILSLTCEAGKDSYAQMGTKQTRAQIDNKLGKANDLANNLVIYLDKEHPELKSLGFDCTMFKIHEIDQDICMNYDSLDIKQFKAVVDHIHYHFRISMNKNRASGTHETYCSYVDNHFWLMLLHHRLHSNGTSIALRQVADPVLPTVVTTLSPTQQSDITSESQYISGSTNDTPPSSPSMRNQKNKRNETNAMISSKRKLLFNESRRSAVLRKAEINDRFDELRRRKRKARKELEDSDLDDEDKMEIEEAINNYNKEMKDLREERNQMRHKYDKVSDVNNNNDDNDEE